MNIIYALAAPIRHPGKAVAVVLVIIKIPGSSELSGEMMPNFFQRLKPFLPFTYGIQAMRGPTRDCFQYTGTICSTCCGTCRLPCSSVGEFAPARHEPQRCSTNGWPTPTR